jgi:prephenate dehydrogenase
MALKKSGGDFEVVGHDREPTVASKARKLNAVDSTAWNLINATERADLVILAVPISSVRATLEAMGPDLKEGCLVIDTCSVKRPVLDWADELLPPTVSFVGGNPIVHLPESEPGKNGPDLASDALFKNRMFCLCPSTRTSPEAVQLASDLVSTLGAQPYFLDADEHDGLVAGVEHLPLALSAALLNTVSQSPGWREMRKVAGDTFVRASDLSGSATDALREMSLRNADNMTRWIDDAIRKLYELRNAIREGDEELLSKLFSDALDNRERWIVDRARGFAGEDLPTTPEAPSYWKSMFGMGGGLGRKRGEQKDAEKDKRKR